MDLCTGMSACQITFNSERTCQQTASARYPWTYRAIEAPSHHGFSSASNPEDSIRCIDPRSMDHFTNSSLGLFFQTITLLILMQILENFCTKIFTCFSSAKVFKKKSSVPIFCREDSKPRGDQCVCLEVYYPRIVDVPSQHLYVLVHTASQAFHIIYQLVVHSSSVLQAFSC